MAMKRTIVDGQVLNKRTAAMLARAEARLGYRLRVVQGSYNKGGVAQSAGTHDGGGALDISVRGLSDAQKDEIVKQLRQVGFAAWHRLPSQGDWAEHIHAIAIGDPEMSAGARTQVNEYYAGQNGLANHAEDDGPRYHPIPTFQKLPTLGLAQARAQFARKNPKNYATTKEIQRLLNYRTKAGLVVDGNPGPKTKAAWKNWEKKFGAKNPNSLPNYTTLKALAAGYDRVVPVAVK